MSINARIHVHCVGECITASEIDKLHPREDGRTIVVIDVKCAAFVLGNVSADQLDSLASDLRTIAQDVRIGRRCPMVTDDVVDAVSAE